MEFSDLIQENSSEVEIVKEQEGYKDGPNWIPGGEDAYTVDIAVFYLSPEEFKYYEGGNYTTQDIKLLVPENTTFINQDTGQEEEIELDFDDEIKFDGNKFEIKEDKNQTIHSDFYEYVAKKVNPDD
jgi:hypothetical protein